MNLKEIKGLIKPFILIFIASFIIINWSDISWFFNYHFWQNAYRSIGEEEETKLIEGNYQKEMHSDSIEIPKLGIKAPLIIGQSQDKDILEKNLLKGAVYFPSSALPGQDGQTVILGHSAPSNWPKTNYDWIFSNISQLESGDKIIVYYNNQKYTYNVEERMILEKGEDAPKLLTNNINMLLLISCWPPGQDSQRIAVRAELN